MRIFLFFGILFHFACGIFAQKPARQNAYDRNAIFVEILGNSGSLSINYDHLLFLFPQLKIAGRIGLAFLPVNDVISGIPFEISLLVPSGRNHHFELGTGLSYIKGIQNEHIMALLVGEIVKTSESLYIPFRLGYRYQREKGGFFLKAGVVPVVSIYEFEKHFSGKSHLWFGLGLGYSF
ncbi:MAG: hypothetical protein JXB00_14235 [Bacteroidales bacterium]|nr:hypothetical protein [Bacteroidales bacterium]